MVKILSLAFLATYALGTSADITASLSISDFKQINNLPSASASVKLGDRLLAVGDDSPSLYLLDREFQIINSVDINNGKPNKQGRIPGKLKADLEAADKILIDEQEYVVMLGSGTYTDTREKALLYSINTSEIQWRNIKPFYRSLRGKANLSNKQFINIEGLASNDNQVFLLSRGSHGPNLIFVVDKAAFTSYLTGSIEQIDEVKVIKVELPNYQGVEATLSGATWNEATRQLFFTASVDKDNEHILGSFVGVLESAQLVNSGLVKPNAYLISHQGKPLKSKVESITISTVNKNKIAGTLLADNDDGTSQFMRFLLTQTTTK